ncbi:MAG: glycoside hydrolase family 3 protein [Alphaproteobacteria bacterium]|nr:glycoside hydrolase family 3 protein [Alphaproteobacteria bacterium]
MKNKIFATIFLVLLFIGGAFVYYTSMPSVETMAGQMIMTGFHGDGLNDADENFIAVSNQIKKGQIGGVILFDVDVSGLLAQGMDITEAKKHIFSSNIKDVEQVKNLNTKLQSISPTKLLIAIDQEGGNIQRLKSEHGFAPIPSAKQLGTGNVTTTYETAYDLGTRLTNLGFNVDFAPLLDVDVNPESPAIGAKERSFSNHPDTVTEHGAAFARGLEAANIAYSFKHFPGHGSAAGDTHDGITDITNTYQDYELTPYKNLLQYSSPYTMVMVAHVINNNFDTLPASLSKKTIDMIRDMGFNGVIVSDDMDMGAIANKYGTETAIEMAINAGNDILVFGNNLTFDKNRGTDVNAIIVKLVKTGKIKKSRIKESYKRIMAMKKQIAKADRARN